MLIPLNDIILIYEKILEDINIDYVSVVIYTAIDIDSLCALKMLTKFLKSESIQYKIYPVTTYTELEQKIEDSKEYQSVKLFMFINCGGFIDLTEKWFVTRQNNAAKIILFDANKPLHHQNIESNQILVIDDQHSQLDKRVTSQDMNKLQELNEFDLNQEIDNQEDDQSEQNSGDKSPKRKAQTKISQRLKKHKEILDKKISNYYGTTFFSLPTSFCLYRLVRDLNKASNYTLWFAIIGMTSMYLENSISRDNLDMLTNFYRSDMVRFNPQNKEKKEKGEIFTKKGYHFPLMNHWTLYESMMNSSYLMVKLNLWNDKGITKLHEILTRIGISLDQSKQQYKYMLKELKDSLEQKMFTIAENYNLTEITYESFMRQTDSSSSYMASDLYYIISAILQKPIHKSTLQELTQHRIQNFWTAYSLLDGSQDMIKQAVEQFKSMSTIMMKQVKDIIERDSIINIGRINFSNIRCDTKEKRLFEHPSALMRLAHMLMGIQKQRKSAISKSSAPAIPCVVSLLDTQKNICLIVGVVPDHKNNMGTKFSASADKLKIEVKHDRFMANIIIVPKDNLLEFIREVGNMRND